MGAKISKRYSSYKSQPKVLKRFLNFLPNGHHNTAFGIFENLKIEILTNFINFRLHGTQWRENVKALLLLQIAAKSFQTCPEFSGQLFSQNCVEDFEILSFRFLTFFFSKISNSPL